MSNRLITPSSHHPIRKGLPLIGITMGDPTGIGPEIIVKALSTDELFQVCRPLVFGDLQVLTHTIEMLDSPSTVKTFDAIPDGGYAPQKIFLLPVSRLKADSLQWGKPDKACGAAMAAYIEKAVAWASRDKLDAITTCPINKQAVHLAGYPFSGHTELLAHLTKTSSVAMMFVGPKWKVILVTTHLPLKEVSKRITKDRVLSTIRKADEGLRQYFGIPHPRIAVLGLNPHCGEEGLLGNEERSQILPAIAEGKSQGLEVEGPFPADSFFDVSGDPPYDAVISMYHDQGLIPVKMSGFQEAVNLTLGLPFVRTSVGHGTAYDIAGRGLANPTNLMKAILLASKLSNLRH